MVTSAGVVRAGVGLMRWFPVPIARGLAWVVGGLAGFALGERRRVLLESLSYTAPRRTLRERHRLARRTFRNMAGCVVDQFRLPSISPATLRALFEIRGVEHLRRALESGRGALLVSGHIGPYELAAACVAAEGFPVHALVENLDPEVLEALASYRAATGLELINMKDGIRESYRILGKGGILVLAADRAIGVARSAIEVPFCGGIRRVPTGAAMFAMATGAPIVVGFVSRNRERGARYLLEFDPPIFALENGDAERDRITRMISDRIAGFIREHPDEWFVFQPNWITHDKN